MRIFKILQLEGEKVATLSVWGDDPEFIAQLLEEALEEVQTDGGTGRE